MADRSVFISYSHDDGEAVRRDADLLRAGGVLVFIDVRDIAHGERWRDVLRDALLRCERVLVFWSAAARLSEWVDREWRYALELGKKIVPTLLDTTPLPSELAEFQAVRRFDAPPPRRRSDGRLAAAALVLAGAAAAAWWAVDETPLRPAQPPQPLPGASAPLPSPSPPQMQPTPAPPPGAGEPVVPPLTTPASAAGPPPGPVLGPPPPAPSPAPAAQPSLPAALGFVGGLVGLVLMALWVAQHKRRPALAAAARQVPPAFGAPEADARRFVEAVFAA